MAQGIFKWVTAMVKPIFDIRRFYRKIAENANKATQITHSLEMEKLYQMQPGEDLLQFHADITKQVQIIQAQEAELSSELGEDFSLPDYGASILLRAAFRNPKHEEDRTRDFKAQQEMQGGRAGGSYPGAADAPGPSQEGLRRGEKAKR